MSGDIETLLRVVRGRRSVRRFRADPVPPEAIDHALEAARWAPSAGNRQPWRFVVVRDAAMRRSLSEAVRASVEAVKQGLVEDRAAGYSAYLDAFDHFGEAPVVVLVTYRPGRDLLGAGLRNDARGRVDTSAASVVGALSSVAAAIQNFLLALHAQGLGACWMTGPLIAEEALRDLAEVHPGWRIAAVVPVGWPESYPEPPPRRSADRFTRVVPDAATAGPAPCPPEEEAT